MLHWRQILTFILSLAALLVVRTTFAQQLPMGMYEGLLGNSGVALFDSTAPSRYNPSLLKNKGENSYSLGGNAFGAMSSRNSGSEFNSLNLSPTYLSNILSGDSLVHEIFFNSIISGPLQAETKLDNQITKSEIDLVSARFGYSMAWKDFPLALQFLGRYSQRRDFSYFEAIDPIAGTTIIAQSEAEKKFLGASIGISGHARFNVYTLGFNFLSRGLDLYKRSKGRTKSFTKTTSTFTSDVTESEPTDFPEAGHYYAIGHEFRFSGHQFLFDTTFSEETGINNTYVTSQSFGYKLSSRSGTQLLLGFNHRVGPEISYFGQSMFSSIGFSWLTNSLRSALGAYFYNSKLTDQSTIAFGLTYSSEFRY
jgi:hypothetical protein